MNYIAIVVLILMAGCYFFFKNKKEKKVSNELDPILLGTGALNVLKITNSSPRVQMMMGHMTQVKIEKEL